MTTVVIAPDGFGGTLSAVEAATAIATGWRDVNPRDELRLVPMSDGGEGLLDVLHGAGSTMRVAEVAGPLGHPVMARWLLLTDGTAVIESAQACGLALIPVERRDPMLATTHGVGELLDIARAAGARRILVGLGGSASVDGGAGALIALGFRPTVDDGSGLKIGATDLSRVHRLTADWVADWRGVSVELLADVTTALPDAARVFGPQKGASPDQVRHLAVGLGRWADVVERDLMGGGADPRLRDRPGTGAAGGLGYALVAALQASIQVGSARVGELVGLQAALDGADLVITGEGRLDATTSAGKVVTHVADLARAAGIPVRAVVGQVGDGAPELDDLEAAAPTGVVGDAMSEVAEAARRLAAR